MPPFGASAIPTAADDDVVGAAVVLAFCYVDSTRDVIIYDTLGHKKSSYSRGRCVLQLANFTKAWPICASIGSVQCRHMYTVLLLQSCVVHSVLTCA